VLIRFQRISLLEVNYRPQNQYYILITVMQYVSNGWPSKKTDIESDFRVYYNIRTELSAIGQCVPGGCRVLIQSTLRQSLLKLADAGHPGVGRIKSKCQSGGQVLTPKFNKPSAIVKLTLGKSVRPSPPGPLHPVPLPAGP